MVGFAGLADEQAIFPDQVNEQGDALVEILVVKILTVQ